jgi:hypothetical protein
MYLFAEIITLIDALAMILSVVSLIITIVGFFASLRFYRDGVVLQKSANDALTKLEEKTAFIQTQVGGMFDKTLDAAIGKRVVLAESFSELNEQLEQTKEKIIEESLRQIGDASEKERKRLSEVVNKQIELIRQKVETTRESAEEIAENNLKLNRDSVGGRVLRILPIKGEGLTFDEVNERSGLNEQFTKIALDVLHRNGIIERVDSKEGVRFKAIPEKIDSVLVG